MSYQGKPSSNKVIATDQNGILRDVGISGGLTISGSYIVTSIVKSLSVFGVAGSVTTTNDAYTTIGAIVINPSDYPSIDGYTKNMYFRGVLEVSTAGLTGTARLLNSVGQQVTSGSFTSTVAAESGPEAATSSALSTGSTPHLSSGSATYSIQIKRDNGSATDSVTCHLAKIEVTYT